MSNRFRGYEPGRNPRSLRRPVRGFRPWEPGLGDLLSEPTLVITPENAIYAYSRNPYNAAIARYTALGEQREAMWNKAMAANGGVYPGGTVEQLKVLAPELAAAANAVREFEARIRDIEAARRGIQSDSALKARSDAEAQRKADADMLQRLIETGHPPGQPGGATVRYADGRVVTTKPGELAPAPGPTDAGVGPVTPTPIPYDDGVMLHTLPAPMPNGTQAPIPPGVAPVETTDGRLVAPRPTLQFGADDVSAEPAPAAPRNPADAIPAVGVVGIGLVAIGLLWALSKRGRR